MKTSESKANGLKLVIGANRGIGLALAQELLDDPGTKQVIATHRPGCRSEKLSELRDQSEGRLKTLPLEVTHQDSVNAFGSEIAGIEGGFDLALYVAGILHDGNLQPEKSLEQCDPNHLLRLFEINSIAPLMVARSLLGEIDRKRRFTFAALSAMVGSIGDNRRGGWYGYRASKAALNQFLKTLSNECRMRLPRAAIVALHPGTTNTALSAPFQRNIDPAKLYSPEKTATRLIDVLNGVDERRTGQFINWNGSEIPW